MGCEPLALCDFIELWRRIHPPSYTVPIENEAQGRGFDVPHAQARIWEVVMESLELSQQSYFLKPHSIQTRPHAGGPVNASGVVDVTRAAPTLGEILLLPGQALEAVFTDSFGGELLIGRFLVAEQTALEEGVGVTPVNVAAEFPGFAGNVRADTVVRFEAQGRFTVPATLTSVNTALHVPSAATVEDFFTESMINRYVRLVGTLASENAALPRRITGFFQIGGSVGITFDPPLDNVADVGVDISVEVEELEDFGITVTNPLAIAGGVDDTLDAIGADRNDGRVSGENDEQYRDRLCVLDDIISPAAIERIIDRILGPKGIGFEFKETRDVQGLMGFTWDVHPYDFGQVNFLTKQPGSEYVGQGGVWLDEASLLRLFVICVKTTSGGDFGLFYDAMPASAEPFPNAYDLTAPQQVGAYDGFPIEFLDCINNLWQAINAARAAGVAFVILPLEC